MDRGSGILLGYNPPQTKSTVDGKESGTTPSSYKWGYNSYISRVITPVTHL